MNKALHALVYVTLVVAAAALFFEIQLDGKRELLKDRNRQLEDYIVKISNTIEKSDAAKPASLPEARKDVSAVEAKLVDSPETENVLEDYPVQLEEANLETLKWDDKEKKQLRNIYMLDQDGHPYKDDVNGGFMKKGPGTAQELLDLLFERAKAQQAKLNTTRAELANVRTKLEALVNDYNKLKPEGRQDKVTIEEKKAQIEELGQAKAAVEEQLTKTKSQIDDLNAEIKSLKDERDTAKDETEAVKEDLAKTQKLVDQLKKLLQNQPARQQTVASGAVNVAPLTVGNKGKIVEVNSKLMFAVVEFDEDAMKELLGPERQNALPQLEMGIRRTGFQGPAGEYVGRLRLRQSVAGKNFVIADLLGDWLQTEVKKGDVVFAE